MHTRGLCSCMLVMSRKAKDQRLSASTFTLMCSSSFQSDVTMDTSSTLVSEVTAHLSLGLLLTGIDMWWFFLQ